MLRKTMLFTGVALLVPFLVLASDDKKDEKPPMRWEGSLIVSLEVKDLAAAKKWYAETLGATVHYELAEQGWCEMTTPVANTLIGLSQMAAGAKARGRGAVTVIFGVTNIEDSRAFLVKRGVKVAEIYEIPQVVKLLAFEDPDGNLLEFHQPYVAK